jgi:hypothetical protein
MSEAEWKVPISFADLIASISREMNRWTAVTCEFSDRLDRLIEKSNRELRLFEDVTREVSRLASIP